MEDKKILSVSPMKRVCIVQITRPFYRLPYYAIRHIFSTAIRRNLSHAVNKTRLTDFQSDSVVSKSVKVGQVVWWRE